MFIGFAKRFPDRFLLVRYEELSVSPLEVAEGIFQFCGLNICSQVNNFINSSKSRHDSDPYSVYRADANDNDWINIIPDRIVKEIAQELAHTRLEMFLREGKHA